MGPRESEARHVGSMLEGEGDFVPSLSSTRCNPIFIIHVLSSSVAFFLPSIPTFFFLARIKNILLSNYDINSNNFYHMI